MTLRTALLLAVLACVSRAHAQFPVLAGDPVNPDTGRAWAALPGLPLLLPQPDGKFDPPIVDPAHIGDVDLVVRAGHLGLGPVMPSPVASPPVVVAGGTHVTAGGEIPFTVLVSDGSAGLGVPLGGPEMNGMPVLVVAFADLDGDGVVGPLTNDPQGIADDGRERQESDFLVGRQVAVFDGGVAQGSIAVWTGAPASEGGMRVVLTAVAYVGPFTTFFEGNLPDGPPIATLLPIFPRLDPERVIEGRGRGGPAGSGARMGIELEPEFAPPLDDPVLGTPFALPTDGSSPTIDRAVVVSAPLSRFRALRAAAPFAVPVEQQLPLARGAGGVLLEPAGTIELGDDGPGNATAVRLVPVDALDGVTDPPLGAVVEVRAGPGLAITAPDADGDPGRETLAVPSAAGVEVVVDDAGAAADGPATSALTVGFGGFPVETVPVHLTPGTGPGNGPRILGAALADAPAALARRCPADRTVAAVIEGDGITAEAAAAVNGIEVARISLEPGTSVAGALLPAGPLWVGAMSPALAETGVLTLTVTARDAAGMTATPLSVDYPIVEMGQPGVATPLLDPTSVAVGGKRKIVVQARVADDCEGTRVIVETNTGTVWKRAARLRDNGRRQDVAAGDGVYSGLVRIRARRPGPLQVRVVARGRGRNRPTTASIPVTVQVTP